jgi:polyhydroxyalkanoate synthesis regulator phasin
MEDTVTLRGVAAHAAMRNLLDLLVQKGVLTSDEAFRVLEQGADDAQQSLPEIQNETPDA